MGKRLFVVEDDHAIRALLYTLLKSEGYEIDTASDGQCAWEHLSRQPGAYAAVLLDMGLPRLNGVQLIQRLQRQEDAWAHSLMVMSANREALQQAVEMGACYVLEKPFDLDALLALGYHLPGCS
jgi:DNA-binding response OmpR family regulator